MNVSRISVASLAAFVAYFVLGGLMFGLSPLKNEFRNFPAVYRSEEGIKSVMPAGMAALFVAILVVAGVFAMLYPGGARVAEGGRFGALIGGLFVLASLA